VKEEDPSRVTVKKDPSPSAKPINHVKKSLEGRGIDAPDV